MNRPVSVIFRYSRDNRYTHNVLAGAVEDLPGAELRFPETDRALSDEIAAAAAAGRRAVAAVSILSPQAAAALDLAGALKLRFGDAVELVAGGPHVSCGSNAGDALAAGFDRVVTGEGEEALRDIVLGRAHGRLIRGRRAEPGAYPPFSGRYGKYGPIELTRGCPFACSYCQTSYLFGARPRHRSAENVRELVRYMAARDLRDIRFLTPDAFAYGSADGRKADPAAVEALLKGVWEELKGRGQVFFGSFPSEVRPEHVTQEILEAVKPLVSNRRLVIGAQTGSARLLKAIRRGHGVAEIIESARLCRKYKFTANMDFIFGLPGETEADMAETMKVIEELIGLGALVHTHYFMPLPGTPLAAQAPARIPARLEKFINGIESRGKAFGHWRRQRELAGGRTRG